MRPGREAPAGYAPGQEAITGALCIYVEGGKKDDARQMLFGLSVLRHATEEQLRAAIPRAGAVHQLTEAGIRAMLAA